MKRLDGRRFGHGCGIASEFLFPRARKVLPLSLLCIWYLFILMKSHSIDWLALNLQASCSDDRFAPLCSVTSEHLEKRVCALELCWASKVPWRHDSPAGASEPDEVCMGSRSSLCVWWRIYLLHSHFQAMVSDSILRHPGVCVPEN